MRPATYPFLVGAPGYRELVTALVFARRSIWLMMSCSLSDDLAVDVAASDPDWPDQGMSSIRFDNALSRESAPQDTGAAAPTGGDHEAIGESRNRSGGPAG